jgi:peptidoglycan/LPS O-acetylase OafA/YrhL
MEPIATNSQSQHLPRNCNRLDALLALRGFACLMVVVCHCEVIRGSLTKKGYDLTWLLVSAGEVAVWIFFALSGYLMGKAFYSERYSINTVGVINFFRNRILRIFPLYYFSTLILALFITPQILKIENWGYLFRTLTFTYNYSMPVGVNSVLWSLAIEVQFYLCVPFIYAYLKDRLFNRRRIILAFVVISFIQFILRLIVWIVFYTQLHNQELYLIKYWYAPLWMNFDIFLYGFLVNAWFKCEKATLHNQGFFQPLKLLKFLNYNHKIVVTIIVFLLYLFTAHHYYFQELRGLPRPINGVMTPTTFFILQPLTAIVTSYFIFAFESDVYQDFLKNEKLSFEAILRNPLRILEIPGNLSYGIYIWHMPIILKISSIFTSNIPIEAFQARLTATLILSTLLSVVTYYLVELPAARWKIYRKTETEK